MSFLTCFCDFPQKEHFRRSESPNLATAPSLGSPRLGPRILRLSVAPSAHLDERSRRDDVVHDAVVLGLLGRHDEVPVGVLLDLVEGLPGVPGEDLVEELAVPEDLLGLDLDVHGLAARLPVWLMDQHPRVRERVPLALRPRLEVDQLSHDQVGHLVVDRGAEEDDPVLEETRVDVERALPPVRLLDHDWNEVILHPSFPSVSSESAPVTSAFSTTRVRALSRMISPASDVICPPASS